MDNSISSYDKIWTNVIEKSIMLCERQLEATFREESKCSICDLDDYKLKLKKNLQAKASMVERGLFAKY